VQHSLFGTGIEYDEFHRLIGYPRKFSVPCPKQDAQTAVVLAIGQSNSANSGESNFKTKYFGRVVNFFDGKCYEAESPLLGASGQRGEFITLLADHLIERNLAYNVVIVSSGIDGTPVSRWKEGGDLNKLISRVIEGVRERYYITAIIWHQGEQDYLVKTKTNEYVEAFRSLLTTLRNSGVTAPVYIAVATKCSENAPPWQPNNPIAIGQKQLVETGSAYLGANTDEILTEGDRQPDKCHFARSGEEKTASAFADAIEKTALSGAHNHAARVR
jgi:hypothetical protein